MEAPTTRFLSSPAPATADPLLMPFILNSARLSLPAIVPVLFLASCASTPNATEPTSGAASASRPALGMVGPAWLAPARPSPQDGSQDGSQGSDSSFAGKPGDMQDSSFAGKPGQNDPNAMTPSGAGYNQRPGELRPQTGGGDVHYHNHFYGNAGYSAPVYGAPVRNGNLGAYNAGQAQAPLGTGGGGAGWYGPNYETGPLGLRQGYGTFRGANNWNGWGGYADGGFNGWTD